MSAVRFLLMASASVLATASQLLFFLLLAHLRAVAATSLARSGVRFAKTDDARAGANILPFPLTEQACDECEQALSDLHASIVKCRSLLGLMNDAAIENVNASVQDSRIAEKELIVQQNLADSNRQDLATLHRNQAALGDARRAAVQNAAGAAFSLRQSASIAAGRNVGVDLIGRWLLCDSRKSAASLDLQVCSERIESEEMRLAARKSNHQALAGNMAATVQATKDEHELLDRHTAAAVDEVMQSYDHLDSLGASR